MSEQNRERLNFESEAKKTFAFLNDLGFVQVESLLTLVRYQKDDVEIAVYHGRLSYEIGADISYRGMQYKLADVVRAIDPDAAERCGYLMASTTGGVAMALDELGSLMQRYGVAALEGDPQFFSTLEEKRKVWMGDYWFDIFASQVRPQAEEAFRLRDYAKAVDLYARIRSCLSPAEKRKLKLAEERSKR